MAHRKRIKKGCATGSTVVTCYKEEKISLESEVEQIY